MIQSKSRRGGIFVLTLFFMCDKILGEKYWDIAKSVRHKTLTLAFRWFESSYPSHDACLI